MTIELLITKYGSADKAAGAVAIGIESLPAERFMLLPEAFRSLVLYKQQLTLLRLAAVGAGTRLQALVLEWRRQETEGV